MILPELLVGVGEVGQVVRDADECLHAGMLGFLHRQELLDGVFVDEREMGVSVEQLHVSSSADGEWSGPGSVPV